METKTRNSHKNINKKLQISKGLVFNILKDNCFHSYHATIVQHLSEKDFLRHLQFCAFLKNQLQKNFSFLFNVLITDEVIFADNCCADRHNLHYFSKIHTGMKNLNFRGVLKLRYGAK